MLIKQIILVFILNILQLPLLGATPEIRIEYPDSGAVVGAVDSNFIFGYVTPGSTLEINGYNIEIYKTGGFLAFLPLQSAEFEYTVTAKLNGKVNSIKWPIKVPTPLIMPGYNTLSIIRTGILDEPHSFSIGDRIIISFRGTPGCVAWAEIPGVADSIPMAEESPRPQFLWIESVIGSSNIPDSLLLRGKYVGYYEVGSEGFDDYRRMIYHLRAPGIIDIVTHLTKTRVRQIDFSALDLLRLNQEMLQDSSAILVRLNPNEYPKTVQFIDSVQRIRVEPGKGYLTIFQPAGVQALAVSEAGNWHKLKLSQNQFGWVRKDKVRAFEKGILPKRSLLRSVGAYQHDDYVDIELPLGAKHPYRVEITDDKNIELYLCGVNSDTDWLRYESNDNDLSFMRWSQPEQELYRLNIVLKRPLWGYDTFYNNNKLIFRINRPPQDIKSLKNKTIVIDPGHSPETGAVGPTGLTEREANLSISLILAEELRKKGANVILTRADSAGIALYDRTVLTKLNDADLFVSIHNNALPDGVNPYENNGTSVYYYNWQSFALAGKVYDRLTDALKLPRHGLYHGNLAVTRPPQYPAILVECAFMMIPEQEEKLRNVKFQKKIAVAIKKGIEDFLEDYERRSKN